MSHFPRFRRKKEDATAAPALTRADSDPPENTTASSGDLLPSAPIRRGPRLSPLHVFHRSSGKRSRSHDPPRTKAGTSTSAITTAAQSGNASFSRASLPLDDSGIREDKMKIPAFLDLPVQEINNKFQELSWQEHNRVILAKQNPSPDYRWARVPPHHYPRSLDRYINVQPWNNNRVKLRVPKGHVDYVNASPIVLESSARPAESGSQGDGAAADHRYIAMQGPKRESTDHVWRMIVEQLESPGVIVMLTDTHEAGQEKCWPYFPFSPAEPPLEINERDEFGDGFRATVRCEALEETVAGDAIDLRKLVIRVFPPLKTATSPGSVARNNDTDLDPSGPRNGAMTPERTLDDDADIKMKSPTAEIRSAMANVGEISDRVPTPDSTMDEVDAAGQGSPARDTEAVEERIVWHFLYKKWPDFGVPNLEDLDSFFTLMRLSRERNTVPSNPRIVHCSAGVGRSGTFIALEHLMRELDAGVMAHYHKRAATATSLDAANADDTSGLSKDEEAEDLIFSTVTQLREQRCTMVQSLSQYRFIYQVMHKLWHDKYGEAEVGEPAAKRLEVDPFVGD